MSRSKNAARQHFVAPYVSGTETAPTSEGWLKLGKYIQTIGDDTQVGSEEEGFYDGDGTPEVTVTSVAKAYSFEGYFDPEDAAQALISGLELKVGEERKIWHKVIRSDGKKQWVGRATVPAIVAGAGDAVAYQAFSCTIRFDKTPVESDIPAG